MDIDTKDPNSVSESQTGMYELTAVLSHKGRSADGGHYVAWIKEKKTKKWMKFDDDIVSVVSEDEIKKLSGKGGADYFIAYLCVYSAIPIPTSD